MQPFNNEKHEEGKVAKAIENETAKIPSDIFLWAAVGSMAVSLTLKLMNKTKSHDALFIGQWAAPLLILGLYNKVVKLQGSDATDGMGDE